MINHIILLTICNCLGTGKDENINEAFEDFKKNQSYLLSYNYENVIAIQTISEFITDLKLKGDK